MKETTEIYKSRISPIIYGFVWLVVISILFLTGRVVYFNPNPIEIGILILIWLPIIAFILYIMLGIKYIIDKNLLIIKIGHFTERKIPIEDILSLERTSNPISSPANSLKRIGIRYINGEVMISPVKEQDFIRSLKLINPEIKIINLKVAKRKQ